VTAALRVVAHRISDARDELVELDRVIGDGDHGENLKRGFDIWLAAPELDSPDAVLKTLATTLISKVGGAAGPLYGTAFLRAATAVKGHTELDVEAVHAALAAALEGVLARGRAELEDKTMVDALTPAVAAAQTAATVPEALDAAATAAERGADATVELVARKGRASYLGERSKGHMDPGARSTALILRALSDHAAGAT
jgi:dihydroxyacetone kinase-like protein